MPLILKLVLRLYLTFVALFLLSSSFPLFLAQCGDSDFCYQETLWMQIMENPAKSGLNTERLISLTWRDVESNLWR